MIPILLRFGDRLSKTNREQILKSTKLTMNEIKCINIGLDYINIDFKNIINNLPISRGVGGKTLHPAWKAEAQGLARVYLSLRWSDRD